ncbi:MAG TPA: glycoside hydrolase family 99-like domain-containing protein [Casimicrobiaceae bacterium]|nr:glycoside hydrolase family 99-like domain-containing protein [Casimicrobiaceae bacterium]
MPADPSFPAPASRNAPCPCGSGRRYKECHGALGADAQSLAAVLHDALAAQQAGRLADAIAGYERALAMAPSQFDALHMLGVARFQRGEFEQALALIERALEQRPGDPGATFNHRLVVTALARRPAAREIALEAQAFAEAMARGEARADDRAVRVIAFYLPQYHRIAENDAWWGEGFTEWTNVRRARPLFAGHAQPHVPGELGWYDLTRADVREAQAALARAHGVDAFCYYHYWFGGRRLLERPLDAVLASGRPEFPFCVCWANEHWTRRWDGLDREVLMPQRYSPEDARAFIDSLLPLFRDRRYVRVRGRPLLLVYKIAEIPDLAATVRTWRSVCVDAGVGDPYLAAVQRHALDDPAPFGFDAAVEFPPIGHAAENVTPQMPQLDPSFRGSVFGYANLAADYLLRARPAFVQFRGVTPMWDNTARRPQDGMVVHGSTPEAFGVWALHALHQTRRRHDGDARLLFVNAWNEWAEGNHLEPDQAHGRRYLEALATARGLASRPEPTRPAFDDVVRQTRSLVEDGTLAIERFGTGPVAGDGLSVVMPAYNHARFLPGTLAALAAQTRPPDEVVVVDDGSTDGSADVVARWARGAGLPVTLVRQRNAGAHAALNRGMALARGATLALANSDDRYARERLERLAGALGDGRMLAFSAVTTIDDDDRPCTTPYARELVARVAELGMLPTMLHALVRHNAAVSTGNLVFRRALLERTGGFAALRVCHDWDFVLAASRATRFAFVDAPLYAYRLHGGNTFSGLALAGRLEGDLVLDRFLRDVATHPWLGPEEVGAFADFLRGAGLGGYLR